MLDSLLSPLGRPSTTRWLTGLETSPLQILAVGQPSAQAANSATPRDAQSEHDKPLAPANPNVPLSLTHISRPLGLSDVVAS
jgi:hypothetical protein